MTMFKDTYPVFEANQVLTNHHLNQEFEYLDEQVRLTRSRLIGIGIVCGLEISVVNNNKIHLTKGCGVSSQGYLLIQPEDVTLERFKPYIVPTDLAYEPFFKDLDENAVNDYGYTFWELLEADEPGSQQLSAVFLQDKAVLLFLELKKDDLRNCSPNSCADRGAEVKATLRKLLLSRADLEKMAKTLIAEGKPEPVQTHLEARLNLPDLRLPRYDVPNTFPVASEAVLSAFFQVFTRSGLFNKTTSAFEAAYSAFRPVLEKQYPANPFGTFKTGFSFLATRPSRDTQVLFLQYYYDLFDDLLKAYDEFRWAALDLMCACCPDEDLFPRHLTLGLLFPLPDERPDAHHHLFLPSPALSGCEGRTEDVQQLFRRLVEMTARFRNLLEGRQPVGGYAVRITPSKLADVPLSHKAIPYYYDQSGTPPLYRLWNVEKTRRNRAHQNLGYRAVDTYAVDDFVKQPLLYDLEPYNFLRIEGHLGRDVQEVLTTLLSYRDQYRLPIDIVALRTGFFDENAPEPEKEPCHFNDLETLYDTLKADLSCFLFHEMTFFYARPLDVSYILNKDNIAAAPLIRAYDARYPVTPDSMGGYFEHYTYYGKTYGALADRRQAAPNPGNGPLMVNRRLLYNVMFLMEKLFETMSVDLAGFDAAAFKDIYEELETAVATAKTDWESQAPGTLPNMLIWEPVDDHLDAMLYACRSEAFKTLDEEYKRRIREIKKQQFLSVFLEKNPGIQHKAGVPLGGTFILVYHDDPDPVKPAPATGTAISLPAEDLPSKDIPFEPEGTTTLDWDAIQTLPKSTGAEESPGNQFKTRGEELEVYNKAVINVQSDPLLMQNESVLNLLNLLTGQIVSAGGTPVFGSDLPVETRDIFISTVNGLADGTVIADFYLPYLCCSGCSPVQFVLPTPPLNFAVKVNCTDANGKAPVTITPLGGQEPYNLKVDGIFKPLEAFSLAPGSHTIVLFDAKGNQSAEQIIVVPERLTLVNERYETVERIENQLFYKAKFDIQGGAPPFTLLSGGEITENNGVYTFTSPKMPDGGQELVKIAYGDNCFAEKTYRCVCPDFSILPFCTDAISNKATVRLNISAGTAPFKYKLNNAATFTNLPANKELSLAPGDYTIVLLDSKQVQSLPVSFTVYAPLSISEPVPKWSGPFQRRNYVLEFDIFGGKQPYQVNNAAGTIEYTRGNPPRFISKSVQCPGKLTVTITDAANCTLTRTFNPCSFENPREEPIGGISIVKDPSGESFIDVKSKSGESGIQYKLNDDEYKPVTGRIALGSGTHTLTFKDAGGIESLPQKITVPASDLGSGTQTFKTKTLEDGSIAHTVSFEVKGGKPPYQAEGGVIEGVQFTSDPVSEGGSVQATISDSTGDTFSQPFFFEFMAPKPAFTVHLEPTNPHNEALATLEITAGTEPFELKVDNGEFKPLTGLLLLSPGTHTLIIRDQQGNESEPAEVVVPPYEPLETGKEDYNCIQDANGKTMYTVAFDILGGTAPYSSGNGRITDGRFTSHPIARGLETEVIVTDAVGDRVAKKFRYDCPVPKPAFTVNLEATNPRNDAQVTLNPTAGTPPFEFKLDDGEYRPLGGPFLLHAGPHTITIRDINGSESEPAEVKVPEYVTPIKLKMLDLNCGSFGNGVKMYAAVFDVQGGTPPYAANWGNVNGSRYHTELIPSGEPFEVTVTDSLGNSVSQLLHHVCPSEEPVFTVQAACTGANGLAPVTVHVQAGLPPFRVLLDGRDNRPLDGPLALAAGKHTIQVIDANGQSSGVQEIVIPETVAFVDVVFDCLPSQPGVKPRFVVKLKIQGGTPPYRTENGAIEGNLFTSLPVAGGEALAVKITDGAGCQLTETYRHECPAAPKPAFTLAPGCTGDNGIAQVKIDIQAGARPFQLKVDDQDFKPLSNPLPLNAGEHTIILRDASGFEADPLKIVVPDALTLVTEKFECIAGPAGKQTYQVYLEIKGGIPPYQSEMGRVNGNRIVSQAVPSGESLKLTVTDSGGCRVSKTLRYECQLPAPVFTLTAACTDAKGLAPLKFDIREGTAPYYYKVDGQEFKPLIDPVLIGAGKHSIVVRDAMGTDSEPQTINIPEAITLMPETYECRKDEKGQAVYVVSLDIRGGVPPYTASSGRIVENQFISGQIISGQALELRISDSAGCRVSKTLRHECPVGMLIVHPNLGPTNAANFAKLTLKIESGTAPFTYKLDKQEYQPLPEIITLSAGTHTIIVRDATGVESAPLAVEVPPALSASKETYHCVSLAEGRQVYTVKFEITGGTPPYQATNGTLRGATFESVQTESGAALNVEINDARGTRIERTFKHECADTRLCTLPCEGQALRNGYRLWLAESSKSVPYTRYEINSAKFVFDGPDGRKIDLSRHFGLLIQATPEQLNADFAATVKGWTDKINAEIARAAGMKDWLRLDFTPAANVRFSTLWIEHFQCLGFEIQVNVSTARLEGKEKYLYEYTTKGTEITPISAPMTELQAPFVIPPFHRMVKDKCLELTGGVSLEWKPIAKPFNLPVRILKTVQGNEVTLQAQASELAKALLDGSVSFIWEVADAAPVLAMGEKARFKFLNLTPSEKKAVLIAIHQSGASVMTTDTIILPPTKTK